MVWFWSFFISLIKSKTLAGKSILVWCVIGEALFRVQVILSIQRLLQEYESVLNVHLRSRKPLLIQVYNSGRIIHGLVQVNLCITSCLLAN